ncbi:MAG: imidazolonepropionase [Candidatus Puniceispirillaceae bacterium]
MKALITNAAMALLDDQLTNAVEKGVTDESYGLIPNGYLFMQNGMITAFGPMSALQENLASNKAMNQIDDAIDADGRLLTPAFIDCHTHVVYGGHRALEFEMRLEGASYTEVAKAGGGIVSTVGATRLQSVEQLVEGALARVDALIAEGISLIEIKSGYGLDIQTELRMLRAARAIEGARPVRVVTSFLGAHAMPPDEDMSPEDYIEKTCIPALRQAHKEGLVDAVDGFCESIAFSAEQIAPLFDVAAELGLPVKLHAEQLTRCGGSLLAARHKALSADHVEYANKEDVIALAAAGCTAVLLPGAFYTLRETQKPPVALFRDQGVPMALATDANPGSSPLTSVLLAMNMGCTLFGMTPYEALAGVTRNAARALGISDSGMLRSGLRADLALWDVAHPAELAYRIGFNPLHRRIFGGDIT